MVVCNIVKTQLKVSPQLTRPRIVGVSHIGLFVHDMEKSLAFYRDLLGFEEQYELTKPDGGLAMKFIKVNDRQCVELFPERSPTEDRLYQVALIVEDIEAVRSHLATAGITVPEKAPKGRIGNLNFSIKDPDGHIVEFVQYTSDGWTLGDSGKHLGPARISARIKHLGFTVRDLDASLAFYRNILGCTETWRGSPDGERLAWVNVKLPDSDEYLELMLLNEEPNWERKGVLNHMSLEVDDVPDAVEVVAARAHDGLYDRPLTHKVGINRKRQCNLIDPDGTRAELMEPNTIDGMSPAWFQPPAAK